MNSSFIMDLKCIYHGPEMRFFPWTLLAPPEANCDIYMELVDSHA